MSVFAKLFKNRFCCVAPRPNSVLLVETNGCHAEVMAGYIPYFQQMGFNVDCLLHDRVWRERPFVRHDASKLRIYHTSNRGFNLCFRSPNLMQYKHIVVMSSVKHRTDKKYIPELYPDLMRHPSIFFVHHGVDLMMGYYANTPNPIMLGRFKGAIFANPHLFGTVHTLPRNNITEFVVVGGIDARRKNHSLLINAIKDLDAAGFEFFVNIIGDGRISELPDAVRRHVRILGHLDFDDMYDCVERSDFYLPLLDAENPDHERYITQQVTGSMQLVYGFACVPVVDKKFADFYDLNNKNAVLYSGDLAGAMQRAIEMSDDTYDKTRRVLTKTATNIASETQENFKRLFNV